MIISKDLFLLGEQDYLRLPKDEKRRIKGTGNAASNGGAVATANGAGRGAGGTGNGASGVVVGAGGKTSTVVSSAAVIASTGMGKDPNDDLR